MRERTTRITLLLVFLLTIFSVCVAWPSDPNRYLPNFIPWPKATCAGPVCIGKGIDIFGVDRREMRLGLDLRGGTRLVLEADISQQPGIDLNDALNSAVDVVERRVNAFGVAESITERVGANRISVQLPGISADDAISKIGRTAQLQFMELQRTPTGDVQLKTPGADGKTTVPFAQISQDPVQLENAVWIPVAANDNEGIRRELTGAYLDRSKIFVKPNAAGLPELQFGMNGDGSKLLGDATSRLSNPAQPMAFFLDDEPIRGSDGHILAPLVRGQITGTGVISGLTLADAQSLGTLLRTGAFPVPLNVVQQEEVDATLGDTAVVHTVEAGLVAIAIVMTFMVLYYRLPGALASLALFVYVSVTLMVFKMFPVTITSAGMAAFVLSVGMAVDANILIFERMKEELRLGRSLTAAIDTGFSRAWTSIRDSNASTVITCLILYWFGDQFGASLVKGFALTLGLGVLVSMFSAITVTRTFLHALVGTPVMRHLWLFGSDVEEARNAVARGATPVPIEGGGAGS